MAFYEKIDERCEVVVKRLSASGHVLKCRAGCCGCCRDELTMTQAEAAVIRRLFPDIGKEKAHGEGACPFLDEAGLCRIYAARPYICRTHGLPMQILISASEASEMGIEVPEVSEESDASFELRDICEENTETVDVMGLSEEEMWNGSVAEAQIAAMDLCTYGESVRISMRSFFQN